MRTIYLRKKFHATSLILQFINSFECGASIFGRIEGYNILDYKQRFYSAFFQLYLKPS